MNDENLSKQYIDLSYDYSITILRDKGQWNLNGQKNLMSQPNFDFTFSHEMYMKTSKAI